MSLKRIITMAGAVALALLGGTVERAYAGADHGDAAAQVAQSHGLTDSQLATMTGGCIAFSPNCFIRKLFKKVIKTIKKWWNGIFGGASSSVESVTEETIQDPTLTSNVDEFYEDTRMTDEFYQDGILADVQESSTGFVFVGSSTGGGGETCITGSGPSCEYQY